MVGVRDKVGGDNRKDGSVKNIGKRQIFKLDTLYSNICITAV